MEEQQQQQETTKDKIKNFVIGFGVLCMIGWMVQYCGGDKGSSSYTPSVSEYPKECKGNCGHPITSKQYDYDGYHMACKRNGNKPSMLERLK